MDVHERCDRGVKPSWEPSVAGGGVMVAVWITADIGRFLNFASEKSEKWVGWEFPAPAASD
ncbi:hypothetical protein C7S18_15860 [Ahniella affigens]|uniref:Uncharacterized protein n=1 Tax=Ahniella affigens TaxID=2021234 RepID=A0A2P1PUR4_9GAMM|nr:hypothetical protein C7S18_15860 [Ahniella affigens]